jgi:hypothetical protein
MKSGFFAPRSSHGAAREIRRARPGSTLQVPISDFLGARSRLRIFFSGLHPDAFNAAAVGQIHVRRRVAAGALWRGLCDRIGVSGSDESERRREVAGRLLECGNG